MAARKLPPRDEESAVATQQGAKQSRRFHLGVQTEEKRGHSTDLPLDAACLNS